MLVRHHQHARTFWIRWTDVPLQAVYMNREIFPKILDSSKVSEKCWSPSRTTVRVRTEHCSIRTALLWIWNSSLLWCCSCALARCETKIRHVQPWESEMLYHFVTANIASHNFQSTCCWWVCRNSADIDTICLVCMYIWCTWKSSIT